MGKTNSSNLVEDEILANEVKKFPCLYDKRSPGYKEKETTDSAWETVEKALGYEQGTASKRFEALRKRFNKRRRLLLMNTASWCSKCDISSQDGDLKEYNFMLWLGPHVQPRKIKPETPTYEPTSMVQVYRTKTEDGDDVNDVMHDVTESMMADGDDDDDVEEEDEEESPSFVKDGGIKREVNERNNMVDQINMADKNEMPDRFNMTDMNSIQDKNIMEDKNMSNRIDVADRNDMADKIDMSSKSNISDKSNIADRNNTSIRNIADRIIMADRYNISNATTSGEKRGLPTDTDINTINHDDANYLNRKIDRPKRPCPPTSPSADEIFGKMVASELSMLPNHIKIHAKHELSNVLYRYQVQAQSPIVIETLPPPVVMATSTHTNFVPYRRTGASPSQPY